MLLWLIIGCEIGFWLFLFLGLFVRYILGSPKTGKVVLLCVPLLDLTLLLATAIDLHNGAVAEFAHGLAAVYLGFTVVYGPEVIKWLDRLAAQRFNNTERVVDVERYGWDHALYEWRQWLKAVLAGVISSFLLYAAILYVGNSVRTAQLSEWLSYIFWVLLIWLACWPLWHTVFPKKQAKL
ncbi:hypothetical protein E0Z06_01180 [Rheinheimera sp. D18]|uniref:hypothetical protein n=1 Tax=Rheinheimera sp. D18 TaxID=2545632 RepID=UPI0010463E4B|nr:hypothetical protein [Rheinheimera sp. D18]QBL08220.1 hypothetical protein E0Z06_01180 [Rheinheimera sp. D18]